jgi:hypothetical protein
MPHIPDSFFIDKSGKIRKIAGIYYDETYEHF